MYLCYSKLKAAKLKLHRLQELVGMVQHVPSLAGSLPSELAAITASLQVDDDDDDDDDEGEVNMNSDQGAVAGETEQEALTRRVEREVDALR